MVDASPWLVARDVAEPLQSTPRITEHLGHVSSLHRRQVQLGVAFHQLRRPQPDFVNRRSEQLGRFLDHLVHVSSRKQMEQLLAARNQLVVGARQDARPRRRHPNNVRAGKLVGQQLDLVLHRLRPEAEQIWGEPRKHLGLERRQQLADRVEARRQRLRVAPHAAEELRLARHVLRRHRRQSGRAPEAAHLVPAHARVARHKRALAILQVRIKLATIKAWDLGKWGRAGRPL
mmetsp:Transcript_449/g.928  ORF Transcript_449/g.928 Transcript_449/m.928 type:complete len:232 (-) Transcript_449:287-982(-)